MSKSDQIKPYISSEDNIAEFTPKAILFGSIFGIIFGASTVYLALRAGLTVSASIPIAVVAISLLKRFGGSTILENNLVQTIGSAGESIAAGVVFTLPGFLFLSTTSGGESFFTYWTIFTLALLGGVLGTLMMIPLRRALIVNEHKDLPYPEGTACASVLIAGEKGGNLAKKAYTGLAFGIVYALFQLVFKVIAETPTWVSNMKSKIFPAATINANITPEYLGVGYIIGIRNSGLLVAGGVLAWLGMIPLLATLVPEPQIAVQLNKLGYLKDVAANGPYGWDVATQSFSELNRAIYFAYVRQIGAGMVAAGGFITLLKTIPTIISAFKGALVSLKNKDTQKQTKRIDQDLPISVVIFGSIALVLIVAILPFIPGEGLASKLFLGLLMIVFGFFFVTVSSRIVGIIGSSSNPISGMTIAALMSTCLIFVALGWTADVYQPMALCVGGIVCIAAANAGATSQDLKTGYLVGATPRHQQVGLMIGALAAAIVIGWTIKILDNAQIDPTTGQMIHMIGSERFPAPQGTLMATLIKGLLAASLDWQFVLVGVSIAITMELCGVRALAFAVGAYLPLSTTLPIFCGGVIRHFSSVRNGSIPDGHGGEEELGPGNLFSTGLIAGGALAGIFVAILTASSDKVASLRSLLGKLNFEEAVKHSLGSSGFDILGVVAFLIMGLTLYRVATKKSD